MLVGLCPDCETTLVLSCESDARRLPSGNDNRLLGSFFLRHQDSVDGIQNGFDRGFDRVS